MMKFLRNLFGKDKMEKRDVAREDFLKHYELKSEGLERVLGPALDVVGHAIVPFAAGGAVDMYYYPHAIAGTGFATMELIEPNGSGPVPNELGTYELVGFTRHSYPADEDEGSPFHKIERRMCGLFTAIGNYSMQAKLKPGDTCEIPRDDGSTRCVVFFEYKPEGREFFIGRRRHGLLLVIELMREEMEYARKNGSGRLLEKLREREVYPYSDLDREKAI